MVTRVSVVLFSLISGVVSNGVWAVDLANHISDSLEPDSLARLRRKSGLLEKHLPLEIDAMRSVQRIFQGVIDSQRIKDPLAAFTAACSLTNIQTIISSAEDVLKCLKAADASVVSIGVGASPAIKQNIDQYIGYLDEASVDCTQLKALAPEFQEITGDIPNPAF